MFRDWHSTKVLLYIVYLVFSFASLKIQDMIRNALLYFLMTFCCLYGSAQDANPEILWATYFGSTGGDFPGGVITDNENNIYMTSTITASGAPVKTGVHQTYYGGGGADVMLTKFDKSGKVIWSTYFGGSGSDETYYPIRLLSDGGIVVTGFTNSSSNIATSGAHQTSYKGNKDNFIALFEPNGKLRWATYFGGSGEEIEVGITVDTHDNILVAGFTNSTSGIATANTFQSQNKGSYDGYIAKFDKEGNLQWSTYYGGVGIDYLFSITTDSKDNIYASGEVGSVGLATPGSYKSSFGGNTDGILIKLGTDGNRLWATYFGAGGQEGIYYIASSPKDNIYITGLTKSPGGIASDGAYQTTIGGKDDIFLAKFDTTGNRVWSTYFGGEAWDTNFSLDFDKQNNIYLGAMTQSYALPITEDALSGIYNGGTWDAAFIKFNAEGNLIWATYFGGEGNDRAFDIKLDSEQNIISCINSDSKDLATPDATYKVPKGNDALLLKMKDATIVGTKELELLEPLQVFPNPTSAVINIPNTGKESRNITIYNTMGEPVRRYIFTLKTDFDISTLPNGQYYIIAEYGNKKTVAKMVKVQL